MHLDFFTSKTYILIFTTTYEWSLYILCYLSDIASHSNIWECVLKDVRGKLKECCLALDGLESISIVNDGSIGKLRPMNLNSFMVNTAKWECSTKLAKVWICFNKLSKKTFKAVFYSLWLFRQYVILTINGSESFQLLLKEIK